MTLDLVLDTNVFVSALMSRRGASYKLMMLLGSDAFSIHISVPLVLEYETVAKRFSGTKISLSAKEIDDVIDYLCAVAKHHEINYLWRPVLNDARDEMVLELAANSGYDYIVTYNVRDFQAAERFGVEAITPQRVLEMIGEVR